MEGTNPGDLWISTDSGVSWTDVPAAGARTWVKAVMSSDGKYIYGTDTSNTVITSSDYGVNWTTHTVTGAGQLRAITTSADGKYLVVSDSAGGGGNIWYSTNFGVNWTDTGVHALNWNAFAMTSSADGKYVTTATYNNGDVWTSSDFGATWTQRTASIDQLDGLAASSSGKYLAAAGNGGGTSYVWTSSDYGVTWTQQSGAGQGNWRSIVISADGSRIATVDYGPGFIWTGFDPSLVPGLPNTGNGTPTNTWPMLLAEITLFAVGTIMLGHKYLNR